MKTGLLTIAARLSNNELLARVKHLARHKREVTACLVAHLAELDERRLYLGEGCSSLFAYCTEILFFSEYAAYGRIQAARAARKFPVVLERLASGAVNLTTLGLLAPHLTSENHLELLEAARQKSKRQVEEVVARVRPLPAVSASIRKLKPSVAVVPAAAQPMAPPGTPGAPAPGPPLSVAPNPPSAAATPRFEHPAGVSVPAPSRAAVTPLAPDLYKIQFTATAETHEKLRRAQDLLRHQIPDGNPGTVIDRALSVLLEHLEKTKLAAVDRPRHGRPTGRGSRHIPAAVRRVVWRRDGGRCAFVSHDGHPCRELGFLEFHHVKPHCDGGEPTVENIELRCRAHNQYEADLYFGPNNTATRKAPPPTDSVVRESRALYLLHGTATDIRPIDRDASR